MDTNELKRALHHLLESRRVGVLATHNQGQPYGSLVAFTVAEDLTTLVFTTGRGTRKFANLSADSRVALVVDNRTNDDADFYEAAAVTATGECEVLAGQQADEARNNFLERHPQLDHFVNAPSCAIVRIIVERYTYVSRFQEVVELDMP
jgi:nitroimidazol reductase NimA-like FMN-containing flavoprotein (pyridoxamine 5'-phosphate oxidase superfamily)